MRILFIGYSNLIKRRILPFIEQIGSIDAVDIAKFDLQKDEEIEHYNLPGKIFTSYEEAINKSKAELAYISTVNSVHGIWSEKALNRGMHVIVDKPAFLNLEKTLAMVSLAKERHLGIAEATVYPFHSQIYKVIDIINNENLYPTNLTINFSFPPMNSDNFRYNKNLGGGAINDLGPYCVSAGRIFFNNVPERIFCLINDYDVRCDVETSFSVLAQYSNGRSLIGNFGFNSEYLNRLNILGTNFSVEINRVFSPPAELENEVLFKMNNSLQVMKTERSNCFINFLQKFIESINVGDFSIYSSSIVSDAKSMELLKMNMINKDI
jgi:dTDP-3,4-didehydro-2,6-dideoxy-alpha-D-glucose 3-reductase